MANNQSIAITDKTFELAKPKQMVAMANVLKQHVVKQNLYTNIHGKNYAHVEGWQFAGNLMGLFPRIVKAENLSTQSEVKWLVEAELVERSTGEIVGRGFAICSSKEGKKKGFDEYAILSMAQTRAIGKAYRNLVGYVMKLAGYEGTPSEEMRKYDEPAREPEIQTEAHTEHKDFVCSKCGDDISEQEHTFSKRVFGKALCREDQKGVKRKAPGK